VTVQYIAGKGMLLTLPGQTVLLPKHWTVAVIQKQLKELVEYTS